MDDVAKSVPLRTSGGVEADSVVETLGGTEITIVSNYMGESLALENRYRGLIQGQTGMLLT